MIINITNKTNANNQPSMSFPSSQSLIRSRPLLGHANSSSSSSCSGRLGELAGGTTAECAAICCCCPCGLVNLLVLTMYKVPVGICRRALRRKRRKKLIKKGLLPPRTRSCSCDYDGTELQIHPMACVEDSLREFDEEAALKEEEAMVKLEKEMWETFCGTGFWRSSSQRELPFKRSVSSPREAPKARI
ncbi:hypothetical protein POPTR_006G200100v4 [Populus trichocarpa]|uniref:Uncharacterized protein n=1 Tax=Populus trichocarpa TaxID=3694 RepID=B9H9M8_POPTR|nr:uncharacterized protein LOC7479487 [Populus trichocarpa]PNT32641.1 hypothetical protein POPTR_006G200100v4 [Populus trichocarpa]